MITKNNNKQLLINSNKKSTKILLSNHLNKKVNKNRENWNKVIYKCK
jgi:hypothetical protein